MKIVIINGVNLNMTGVREKRVYGNQNYESICEELRAYAERILPHCEIEFYQSNHEGDLVDKLHACLHADGVILNAGAFTHYSYAIADAIGCIEPVPVIEVHLSNVHARESFRNVSVIAPRCKGSICGFGIDSYKLALSYFALAGGK